jgi:hypothetical protein
MRSPLLTAWAAARERQRARNNYQEIEAKLVFASISWYGESGQQKAL